MSQELVEITMPITQETIHAYAGLTNDFNPIHVDAEFARQTPLGQPIAHGTLSINLLWLSLVRTLGASALVGSTLDIRFLKPVFADTVVTAGGRLHDAQPGLYDVWVKDSAGTVMIGGTVSVAPSTAAPGASQC